MQRSDYDFDVISGPSTPAPAPMAAGLSSVLAPQPPRAAAPAPSRPAAEETAKAGEDA